MGKWWRFRVVAPIKYYFVCVDHIIGLVHDCNISIANALEILQSCAKPWHVVQCIRQRCPIVSMSLCRHCVSSNYHDDVIKWKHFPRYWPFVRGIHRSPVNSPHKGQWRRALMFTLICARINGWVNNREAGDLRRYRAHYDVIVMLWNNATSVYW